MWRALPAILLSSACATAAPPPAPSLVFLVRHAEKATDDPKDPTLSEAGHLRASELARVLRNAGVTHLFSSEYKRTHQTLEQLSQELGLGISEVSSRATDAQAAALRALPPGSIAVVAGHSNTLPQLAHALGAELRELDSVDGEARLHDHQYDRLFLLVRYGERYQAVELRFGAASEPPAPEGTITSRPAGAFSVAGSGK